jgi:DNA-binding NarL/FixJ family response regulator
MRQRKPTRFTPQEWRILAMMLECKVNKEIGSALNISVRTVKYHVSNIYHKVGVATRSELIARYAYGR